MSEDPDYRETEYVDLDGGFQVRQITFDEGLVQIDGKRFNIIKKPSSTLHWGIRYKRADEEWSEWYTVGQCGRVIASMLHKEAMESLDYLVEYLEERGTKSQVTSEE